MAPIRDALVWMVTALLAAGAVSSRAGLVLDDPRQGATLGTRSGGTFVADEWQVNGQTDAVFWHVPTITNGAVKFDVRGLHPNECRPWKRTGGTSRQPNIRRKSFR